MKLFLNILWKIVKILFAVAAVLSAIYFWNLDQKLMDWAYAWTRRIRDRKRTEIEF